MAEPVEEYEIETEDAIALVRERGYAVIDPGDAQAVNRLVRAFWANAPEDDDGMDHVTMRNALRALAGLPTAAMPAEPGLEGDVVEDLDGNRWARRADGMWAGSRDKGLTTDVVPWSRIAALREVPREERRI